MARVTVEDCLDNVENRFELVMLATRRARQLAGGMESNLQWENDKPTVMALREIADGLITTKILDELDARASLEEEIAEIEGEDQTEV